MKETSKQTAAEGIREHADILPPENAMIHAGTLPQAKPWRKWAHLTKSLNDAGASAPYLGMAVSYQRLGAPTAGSSHN
jgi:hypothetical protein